MPVTPRTPPTPAKWDWDVLQALYVAGMELSDIVKVPRFAGLSLRYLRMNAWEKKWKSIRDEARHQSAGLIGKSLIDKMAEAEEVHQTWIIEKMSEERVIYEKTKNQMGGKFQLERLQIIKQIDDVARRQLGLDERKPLSDEKRNLGILIQINTGHKHLAKTVNVQVVEEKLSIVGDHNPIKVAFAGASEKTLQTVREIVAEINETEYIPDPTFKPLPSFKTKDILVDEKES